MQCGLTHVSVLPAAATCWGVPPGFRFYPGFSFTQGTSAPCGNTFTVTSDILKTLGENCYKDNNCKGFTVNPVDANNGDVSLLSAHTTLLLPGYHARHCAAASCLYSCLPSQNTLCVKNQTFLFSKLNTNQNDPCQGVFVRGERRSACSPHTCMHGATSSVRRALGVHWKGQNGSFSAGQLCVPDLVCVCVHRALPAETCGQAVPTGYIFYPSYDIDSTNQVCVDYSAQQGWTLVNAYNDIRTVIISQCNSQQNCVGVSFLPGSGDVSVCVCRQLRQTYSLQAAPLQPLGSLISPFLFSTAVTPLCAACVLQVVARACYKNTFANLTRNSFTTTSPCQGVYVKGELTASHCRLAQPYAYTCPHSHTRISDVAFRVARCPGSAMSPVFSMLDAHTMRCG